jgi:hypothetical protein
MQKYPALSKVPPCPTDRSIPSEQEDAHVRKGEFPAHRQEREHVIGQSRATGSSEGSPIS